MSHLEVEETTLPGVGVRHDFKTESADRIGVLHHHSGRLDLLIYDDIDPDSCRSTVNLSEAEGRLLGQLLGASQIVNSMTKLQQSVGGLAIDWITIAGGWACNAMRIDQLQLTSTGVLIVAVIRDDKPTAIPTREFVLQAGDTVVVLGTAAGIQKATSILQDGA